MAKVIKERSAIHRDVVKKSEGSAVHRNVVKRGEGSAVHRNVVKKAVVKKSQTGNVVKKSEGSVIRKAPVAESTNAQPPAEEGSTIRRAPVREGTSAKPLPEESSVVVKSPLAGTNVQPLAEQGSVIRKAPLMADEADIVAEVASDNGGNGAGKAKTVELPEDKKSTIELDVSQKNDALKQAAKQRKLNSVKTQAAAKKEAKAIVTKAQKEARALAQTVEDEVAAAIADAQIQGHAAGLKETESLKAQMEQLTAALSHEVEPEALSASVKVAKALYQAEMEMHPEAIVDVVRQSLMSSRQQREIFVRIHPSHAETLRAHRREIVDVLGRAKDIDIREDVDVDPGGCMVETEIGTVDGRVDTQFEVLARHLTSGGR